MVTEVQVVDFYHVTPSLGPAGETLFGAEGGELVAWVDAWCHRLKHEPGAAAVLIAELATRGATLGKPRLPEAVETALTYLRNQAQGGRLNYAELAEQKIPIGSGVTEAACKVIVKQRLCGSGMKWTEDGASVVLSPRALSYTPERWARFWSKVDRWGFPVEA